MSAVPRSDRWHALPADPQMGQRPKIEKRESAESAAPRDSRDRQRHQIMRADLRAMFLAVADLMSDPTKPASEKDFKVTRDHLRELTRIAEREINAILLSCKPARRRAAPWSGAKETLH